MTLELHRVRPRGHVLCPTVGAGGEDLLRGLPAVDLNQLLFLQEQIRSTAAALAAAEAQEAKAAAALDRTQGSAEATLRRADEARDAYVAALTAYEKPLAEIRALAMTVGSAL